MFSTLSVNPAGTSARLDSKRRSSVACTICHARRVRCNVTISGSPCANCQRDGFECVPHISRRGKHKRIRSREQSSRSPVSNDVPVNTQAPSPAVSEQQPFLHGDPPIEVQHHESEPLPALLPMLVLPSPTATQSVFDEDEGDNSEALVSMVESPMAHDASFEPFFIDDSKCLRFIFNVLHDDVLASNAHFWVPKPTPKSLSAEDMAFLRAKGSFLLPPDEMLEELIHCYFNYVHPLLPVIDPLSFFCRYEAEGPSGVSLLLLQTMLFAASNFVDPQILARSGIPSIKALKRQLYQRAKALYDLDYERNKIFLIQAILLMSYWFADTQDRTDSWHWVGVASSLSQSIGLHRNPGSLNVPDTHKRLWKRVWWCCVYRDRWISLGMGRPSRINMDDCDLPMLTKEDLIVVGQVERLNEKSNTTINTCNSFAPLFVEAAKLSIHLGNVLHCQYAATSRYNPIKIDSCDDALTTWYRELSPDIKVEISIPDDENSWLMSLHRHMLNILYQVTVITLYRPLIFNKGNQINPEQSKQLKEKARAKAGFAASIATESLTRLIGMNLIRYLPPLSVTALSPIIAIYCVERLLTDGLLRQVATQKLELSMMVLGALSEKYWAASFNLKYYRAAFKKIDLALGLRGDTSVSVMKAPSFEGRPLENQDSLSVFDQFELQLPPCDGGFESFFNYTSPSALFNELNASF